MPARDSLLGKTDYLLSCDRPRIIEKIVIPGEPSEFVGSECCGCGVLLTGKDSWGYRYCGACRKARREARHGLS